MRLIFITEARFVKDADGRVFNNEGSLGLNLWRRYLAYFDEVCVVARVHEDPAYVGQDSKRADGDKVSFHLLPYYVGPSQYLRVSFQFKKAIKEITKVSGVFLIRTPGEVGYTAARALRNAGIPYGVEVVGDPLDVFAKGAVRHPLRLYFRYSGWKKLKSVVMHASCAIYVTEKTLQERYPVAKGIFSTSASNVILKDEMIADTPKVFTTKSSYNILSVGSLSQMYKAPDVLLQSIRQLNESGISCHLTWLGSGRHLEEMKSYSEKLGIAMQTSFPGYVSDRKKLFEYLDNTDIFVLVSRTEGLPRAVIEAMSIGLPVVGSRVGGIPELLEDCVLVDKDSAEQLTDKIKMLVGNPEFTNIQAARNLLQSKRFSESYLDLERKKFFEELIRKSYNNGASR